MRGVTLIELLVVIGLMSAFAGISLQSGLSGFDRALARADVSRSNGILRHARSLGMHGEPNEVSWASDAHSLFIISDSAGAESYELSAALQASIMDTILFAGMDAPTNASSLTLFIPETPMWNISVNQLRAIDLIHSL